MFTYIFNYQNIVVIRIEADDEDKARTILDLKIEIIEGMGINVPAASDYKLDHTF